MSKMPSLEELNSLLPWATEKQKLIINARLEGLSWNALEKKTGTNKGNAYRSMISLKSRASKKGWSPDHDMSHAVPDAFNVSGVSSLYGPDGQLKMQWIKSNSDKEAQKRILVDELEAASSLHRAFKPVKKKTKSNDSELLSLLTLTDFHLGMYAWEEESGEAWDMEIAEQVLLNAVKDMIDASPESSTAILNQLGDFLHWDGLTAVTPAHRHVLDADTRYGKLVDMTMFVMQQAIILMLEKFEKVKVIQAEGNHDEAGSVWLRKHLKHMFSNDKRVEVDDSNLPYYAHLHGQTLLCFHHGHKTKLNQLHKLFSSEPRFRPMWGAAQYTYIHTGHFHHEKVIEDGGAIAEMHPTLSARDAYSARGGWVSQRGAKIITYDANEGEVHRVTVRPRLCNGTDRS